MIELKEVSKIYIESDNTITAADNINLTIDTGCFISVVDHRKVKEYDSFVPAAAYEICISICCII